MTRDRAQGYHTSTVVPFPQQHMKHLMMTQYWSEYSAAGDLEEKQNNFWEKPVAPKQW